MKSFLLVATLLLAVSGGHAADSGSPVGTLNAADPAAVPANPPGPRIQFASPTFDFGKVDAGQVVKCDFVFTNVGDAVLEVTDVRPGCGCTTAGTWDKRIDPGKTGTIPLQLNSTGFSGSVLKSATVTCNDVTRSNVFLQIKGTIWRAIDITPLSAYFSISGEAPTNETRVVRIVNNLDEPLTLSEPECTNSAFRVELKAVKPGKEFELRVAAVPPFAPTFTQARITLKTSSTNMPVITIPTYVNVQPVVTVMPSTLMLPAGPLTAGTRPSVTIRNSGTNSLTLSDAAINVPGAEVEVKEVSPGRLFSLSVSFPPGFQSQSTQRMEMSLKSNHPKFPVIKVPVYQTQRPLPPRPASPFPPLPSMTRTGAPTPQLVPVRGGSTASVPGGK